MTIFQYYFLRRKNENNINKTQTLENFYMHLCKWQLVKEKIALPFTE